MEHDPQVMEGRKDNARSGQSGCERGQSENRADQSGCVHHRNRDGHPRGGAKRHAMRAVQTRAKIRVPFVPPNPNEFESAVRIGISRAVIGT